MAKEAKKPWRELTKNRIPTGPTQAPFTPQQRAMLVGRPSTYLERYEQDVIALLSQGYSIGGFAGKIGVARSTVQDWRDKYPSFDAACGRAMAVRQLWWEDKALEVATTGGQGAQGTMVMFGLINSGREDWRNKSEVEHSGVISLASIVEASMRTIEACTIDGVASPAPAIEIGPSIPPPGAALEIGPSIPPPGAALEIGPSIPPPGAALEIGPSIPPPGAALEIGPSIPPPGAALADDF